jgi:hypothetical protein
MLLFIGLSMIVFAEGVLVPYRYVDKWAYMDQKSNVIGELRYQEAFPFSSGLGRVKLNEKYGFVNTKGEIVIPCIYSWAEDFKRGIAEVKKNGVPMFIDRSGKKTSLPYSSDVKSYTTEGIHIINSKDSMGLKGYNSSSKDVFIKPRYKEIIFRDFFVLVGAEDFNGNWGLLSLQGEVVYPFVYDSIYTLDNDCFIMVKNGQLGAISWLGDVLAKPKYDNLTWYRYCLFTVVNDKKGYIFDGKEYWVND